MSINSILEPSLLFRDYVGERQEQTGTVWTSKTLLSTNISSFGEDNSGELYVLDVSRGIVHKVVARGVLRRRAVH